MIKVRDIRIRYTDDWHVVYKEWMWVHFDTCIEIIYNNINERCRSANDVLNVKIDDISILEILKIDIEDIYTIKGNVKLAGDGRSTYFKIPSIGKMKDIAQILYALNDCFKRYGWGGLYNYICELSDPEYVLDEEIFLEMMEGSLYE